MRKNPILLSLFLAIFILLSGCDNKKETPKELISGTTSKTWHETKEKDYNGNKTQLSDQDKNSMMQFYYNGSFTINTPTENSNGTWTYNDSDKTLTLQFTGENVTKSYHVNELSSGTMKLQNPDGSEMTLKTD